MQFKLEKAPRKSIEKKKEKILSTEEVFGAEENDIEEFERYLEDLQLSKEDLSKKILDVGGGSAQFAKWAKENNVNSNIFSLDPVANMQERTKGVQGQAEAIPFQDNSFDLVVSDCAIPNVFLEEKDVKEKVRASLFEMVRVTKPGGEIRLGRVLRGDTYQSQRDLTSVINKTLKELKKIPGIEIEEHYSSVKTNMAKVNLIKIRKL